LWWTAAILAACLFVPRGFCGYVCPLGTLIDGFDWLVGRHFRRWQVRNKSARGWWVHVKYYLLAAVLISSLCGVLLSGFVAAIPVVTRGMMFTAARLQLLIVKGKNHLAPVDWTFWLSIGLFAAVFFLGLLGRRFWCRCLCPSGALFSVANLLRIGERKVEPTCIRCRRCTEICPFDAIQEDYATRTADCTFCQTCGGVCPPGAIQFTSRFPANDGQPEGELSVPPRPDHAGCHQDCNFCTLVCPTGAIQPLDIAVKRRVHMGLARVDTQTCLPFRSADRRECDVCYVECRQAGYDAIELREVEIKLDPPPPEGMFSELELREMTHIRAPFVNAAACVGCGICQYRCHTLYVVQQQILDRSAVRVVAQNDDRLTRWG